MGFGLDCRKTLEVWQRRRLKDFHAQIVAYPDPYVPDVTILAYYYANGSCEDAFQRIECSIRETWWHLGAMHTVLVVNRRFPCIDYFAKRFSNVEIQEEPTLVPGSTRPLSLDCICRLHSRFSTDFVLIVQDDGFPMRGGVDFQRYVGPWDYVGGPWGGRLSYFDLFPYPKFAVGNGGFSLRSRRMCKAAAEHWRGIVRLVVPHTNWFYEDIYYTRAMSVLVPGWRKRFKIAPFDVGKGFAMANILPSPLPHSSPPLGFHSPECFVEYVRLYGRELGLSHECVEAGNAAGISA